MTVDEAVAVREALTGDAALIADLIEVCLNAEAALRMMGVRPIRHKGFLPVGALTLNQIEEVLATRPAEVALVKAAMAFACAFCGNPAETGTDDDWICDACIARSTGQPKPEDEGE